MQQLYIIYLLDGEKFVSFIIPVEGKRNQFAVGILRRIGVIEWDGKSTSAKLLRIAFEVENDEKYANNRFNDAKADPTGRLYSGTLKFSDNLFKFNDGTVYKYKIGEEVKSIIGNIGLSNGIAFDDKKEKMYYIDTALGNVREYDWDRHSGDICELC